MNRDEDRAEGAGPHTAAGQLMLAASRGDYDAASRLLRVEDVNAQDRFGNTALIYAAGGGHVEVVRLLVSAGADASVRNGAGTTALDRASAQGRGDIATLLRRVGREGADGRGEPLTNADRTLLTACRDGDERAAAQLLTRGASAEARAPGGGWTPLITACMHGHAGIAQLLLANGADAGAQVADGRVALHFVLELDDARMIELLLAGGAQPDARDRDGTTPLMIAARDDLEGAARLLLASGADPAATDHFGVDAVETARRRGNLRLSKILRDCQQAVSPGGEQSHE